MQSNKAFRSKTLLDAAKDAPCMLCGLVGSTVAAHVNSVALGKGTGIKAPDYYVAYLCMFCHDLYDGRNSTLTKLQKEEMWYRAYVRTVARWFDQGIVQVC